MDFERLRMDNAALSKEIAEQKAGVALVEKACSDTMQVRTHIFLDDPLLHGVFGPIETAQQGCSRHACRHSRVFHRAHMVCAVVSCQLCMTCG